MTFRSLPFCALMLGSLTAFAGVLVEGQILPFRQVEVCSPVSSRILDLKVKEGDTVKQDQPLALLYGRFEELEMQRAKALLERREFEAKGAKRLFENRIIPESKAVESRIELELARLQYEIAAEQVRLRTVLSPMDGVVVTRSREVGETIATAQPLFRILDLSRVVVQVAVAPRALAGLAPGQKVMVSLPHSEKAQAVEGQVILVDPCADADGRVRVRVLVDNPERRIRLWLKATVELPDPN